MKTLLFIAAVLALAVAKPGTYKESEDFQYSRSSTDEGSKSGYYGAQRGNMGGNFERAHNMDGLAQHQMSTAVKQVEGELGEAAKMKSGDVFTSANSGGMFGSGHYDVSNLQGRNFQESASSYGAADSQSHSSLSSHQSRYSGQQASSALHDSGYNSISHGSGYRGYQGIKGGQELQSGSLQAAENVHDGSGSGYGSGTYGAASSHSTGHSSQSGYQSRTYGSANANQYDSHSAYGTNPQHRLVYATPVRIVGRPGTRVAIPIGVQTYDASHSASTLGQQQSQQAYDSQAEVLYNPDQHISYKPSTDAKHYESAYSYRKQWENHESQPEAFGHAIPTTESPFPKNSELYEDVQSSGHQQQASLASGYSHSDHTSSMHNAYNTNVKSLSASQIQQSAAASQHAGSSSLTHGAYTGDSADTLNVLNGVDTKPKSYQSSYSYHKSWERQGDPYVITPVGETHSSLDSQRLTAASNTHGYSHQTHQGYQSSNGLEDCDCDANAFRRVARSIRNQQQTEDLSQQSQTGWSNPEDLGQHTQRSQDLRQTHAQVQQDEKDVGQQVQQNQWGSLEDLGQQAQSGWEKPADLRQKYAHQQASVQQESEDLGQQVQQNQWSKYEDLGRHAQSGWEKPADLRQKYAHQQTIVQQQDEDLGQQVQQNQWSNLEDLKQHAQISWERPADSRLKYTHQQAHVAEDFGQQVQQSQWSNSRPEPQRNSDQDTLNVWPGYSSEPNKFENQEQQSSHFKPSSLEIEHKPYVPEDQQETTQIVSSNFNQDHQESFNTWLNQAHQEFQTGTFGKETSQKQDFFSGSESLDQDQDTLQQSNNPWGRWGYADQHKNSGEWQATTMPSSWFPEQSNSYYNRQDQSDKAFSGAYNWSQAIDKSHIGGTPISSLWDKISQVDGVFLDTNVQQLGKDHEKVNLTLNQDQYHGSQLGIVSVSTTMKPDNHTNNSTKKLQTVVQDVGRGDIGPEENFGEQEVDTNINTSKENRYISIAKANNVSLIADQVNQGEIDVEKKHSKYYIGEDSIFNKTESKNSSWGTQYYYSGSSYKNQSSQLNNTSEQSQANAASQNKHRLTEFESTNLNLGQQKYKADEIELEQINQDFYQNWQQEDNDTQTVWGQSLESFKQIPQQDTAETFGVRIKEKDKQQKPTVAPLLAESFQRQSVEELGEIIHSDKQQERVPEKLKSPEISHNIKDTQTPQKPANIEGPIETSTSKPGFWKNAKNKFVSWFKSS